MEITFKNSHNQTYEYTLNSDEVQFIITADKNSINYEFNNLYAKSNPNVLYNIFLDLKNELLTNMIIDRGEELTSFNYNFEDPESVYLMYNFSTLERNTNIPGNIRDNEVLRITTTFGNTVPNDTDIPEIME